jgi:hypothetical protein
VYRYQYSYPFILGIVCLVSCTKNSTPSPAPPADTTKTVAMMNVDLTYPSVTSTGNFELIISEQGGKVLLGTIALAAVSCGCLEP